jgi:hypothetical protein
MMIRGAWESKLFKIRDKIDEFGDKEKHPALLNMCRERDVYELEVEGWSVTLAQKDPGRVDDYLSKHLQEVKTKITTSHKGGSASSDTTSTNS